MYRSNELFAGLSFQHFQEKTQTDLRLYLPIDAGRRTVQANCKSTLEVVALFSSLNS